METKPWLLQIEVQCDCEQRPYPHIDHNLPVALGHPLGATGTMILGTALDELERSNKNVALISLCVASGMGSSTIIERV